jgi:hypothetical protein
LTLSSLISPAAILRALRRYLLSVLVNDGLRYSDRHSVQVWPITFTLMQSTLKTAEPIMFHLRVLNSCCWNSANCSSVRFFSDRKPKSDRRISSRRLQPPNIRVAFVQYVLISFDVIPQHKYFPGAVAWILAASWTGVPSAPASTFEDGYFSLHRSRCVLRFAKFSRPLAILIDLPQFQHVKQTFRPAWASLHYDMHIYVSTDIRQEMHFCHIYIYIYKRGPSYIDISIDTS